MLARRAADVRTGGMTAVLPGVIDGAFLNCPFDERREAFLHRFAAQNAQTYALQIEGMLDADTAPYLPGITFPTLIVAGGHDRLLPLDHARQIQEALPASEFVLIEDGAHFIPYQRPHEFSLLAGSFVERLRLSALRGQDQRPSEIALVRRLD
jgi:pimeloyl-ACP methyl ester carboxylesterase